MKTCSRRFWYSSHSNLHICSMSDKLGGLCQREPNFKAISWNIFLVAFKVWHRLGHSIGHFQCWLVVAAVTDFDAGSHQQFAFNTFLDLRPPVATNDVTTTALHGREHAWIMRLAPSFPDSEYCMRTEAFVSSDIRIFCHRKHLQAQLRPL